MYVNLKINKNIKITQLSDLENLRKQMEVFNLKPNFSELARVLKKDRCTIKRHYYQGKTKQTRNKPSKIRHIRIYHISSNVLKTPCITTSYSRIFS